MSSALRASRAPGRLVLALAIIAGGRQAAAGPIAVWDTTWNGSINEHSSTFGVTTIDGRFGILAPANLTANPVGTPGEPLPGTDALARGHAAVSSPPVLGASSTIDINFARTFTLSGSPRGWDVELDGVLAGSLSVSGASRRPLAGVEAAAQIGAPGGPSLLGVAARHVATADTADPNAVPVYDVLSIDNILPDGTYNVTGGLSVHASTGVANPLHPFDTGTADADFLSLTVQILPPPFFFKIVPGGWDVSVRATPLTTPEPGTLATGLAAAVLGLAWRAVRATAAAARAPD
jgi:hypothetical protein